MSSKSRKTFHFIKCSNDTNKENINRQERNPKFYLKVTRCSLITAPADDLFESPALINSGRSALELTTPPRASSTSFSKTRTFMKSSS